MPSLADAIRAKRTERKLTQTQLGQLVNVDNATICRIERGLVPAPSVLGRLAKFLDLDLEVSVKEKVEEPVAK
jgi:transcriptional regulator with XRE-family HTH domain